MNRLLLAVIALFLICTYTVFANDETPRSYKYKISCPVGQTRVYAYNSTVNAFGDEKTAERIDFNGLVKVTCLESHRKANGKDLFNVRVTIPQLNVQMKSPSRRVRSRHKNEKVKRHLRLARKDGDVSDEFKEPIHVTYTSNGKIVGVFHSKNEKPWVTAIKKTIFSKFQTKLTGDLRAEHDAFGNHESHYRKIANKRTGEVRVTKSYTDRDMPRDRFEPGHQRLLMKKQMKMDQETASVLDKDGVVKKVVSTGHFDLGAQRERRHKGFFHDNQNVKYDKTVKKRLTSGNAFKMDQTTSITFVKKFNEKDLPKKGEWAVAIVKLDDSEFSPEIHPNYKRSDLNTDFMHIWSKKEEIKRLLKETKFAVLVGAMKADPTNHSSYLKLAHILREIPNHKELTSLLKEQLSSAVAEFKTMDKSEKRETLRGFINAVRSLLLSSTKAGTVMAESLLEDHPELLKDAVVSGTNGARRWFKKAGPLLYKLYQQHQDEDVKHNAYLMLASALGEQKKTSKFGKKIVRQIINNFVNDEKNPLVHVHAMGNAGEKIPLKYLDAIIRHPDASRVMRAAAIHALRRRSDGAEILADILSDDEFYTEDDRADTIEMMSERSPFADPFNMEKISMKLIRGRSTPFYVKHRLAQLLHKRQEQLDRPMHGLVRAWNKIKHARPQSSDEATLQVQSEALLFRRRRRRGGFFRRIGSGIRRVARRVGSGIRRVARRVGSGVKRVARRVARGVKRVVQKVGAGVRRAIDKVKKFKSSITSIFNKASFKGNQVCLPANNSGDRICLYDAKMISFVRSQGDLSRMVKVKHFEWEKLVGSDKIHLYLGIAAYMGTNFDCSGNDNVFRMAIFAKGLARIVAFTKEVEIVDAHAFVRKNPSIDNAGYLKVVGKVFYNKNFFSVNEQRLCKTFNKQLLSKKFDNMPGYSFTVMIGPIPVKFGFGFSAGLDIDFTAGYCFDDLSANAGITPSIYAGVRASAQISIVILSGGIELEGLYNYALTPGVQLKGMKCQACVNVKSRQRFRLNINARADVNIIVYKKTWRFKLFNVDSPTKSSTLFEKCVAIKK